MTTNCQFGIPVNLGDGGKPDWEFSEINCTSTGNPDGLIYSLIQNSETGAEFYLEKTLNLGDAIIIWFLTIFSFYLIFRIAYNFFWKK